MKLLINLDHKLECWKIAPRHIRRLQENFPDLEVIAVSGPKQIEEAIAEAEIFYGWNIKDHWLEKAEKNSKEIIDQWQKLSIQLGQRVKLSFNGKEFAGNCIGLDPEKGLILQLDTGSVRMFDAAHTSIAK